MDVDESRSAIKQNVSYANSNSCKSLSSASSPCLSSAIGEATGDVPELRSVQAKEPGHEFNQKLKQTRSRYTSSSSSSPSPFPFPSPSPLPSQPLEGEQREKRIAEIKANIELARRAKNEGLSILENEGFNGTTIAKILHVYMSMNADYRAVLDDMPAKKLYEFFTSYVRKSYEQSTRSEDSDVEENGAEHKKGDEEEHRSGSTEPGKRKQVDNTPESSAKKKQKKRFKYQSIENVDSVDI
jgi:hypothetical protein